jgi:hypothetical protein
MWVLFQYDMSLEEGEMRTQTTQREEQETQGAGCCL